MKTEERLEPYVRFVCSKCGEDKPRPAFPYAKDVRHSWCRQCHSAAKKEYRLKLRETVPRKKRLAEDIIDESGNYSCSCCGLFKAKEAFQAGTVGGQCRECKTKRAATYRLKNGVNPRKRSTVTATTKVCGLCNAEKLHKEFSPSPRSSGGLSHACKSCKSKALIGVNLEAKRTATRKYRETNREEYLARHRLTQFKRRTGIEAATDGTITKEVLNKIYATEVCSYCNTATERSKRTLDHIVPLIEGGVHSVSNIVMACHSCNSAKGALPAEKFITRLIERQHDTKR